jgi:hypothetical protein
MGIENSEAFREFMQNKMDELLNGPSQLPIDKQIESLEKFDKMARRLNPFVVGDIITPKENEVLGRKYRYPYGTPLLVLEVLPEVSWAIKEDSSSNPVEILDLVVAAVHPDGQVLPFKVESYRFEKLQ